MSVEYLDGWSSFAGYLRADMRYGLDYARVMTESAISNAVERGGTFNEFSRGWEDAALATIGETL